MAIRGSHYFFILLQKAFSFCCKMIFRFAAKDKIVLQQYKKEYYQAYN